MHRLFADRYVYNGWSRATWPKGEFPLLFRALDLEGELETVQWGLLPSSEGGRGSVEQWEEGEVWSQPELTLLSLVLCPRA